MPSTDLLRRGVGAVPSPCIAGVNEAYDQWQISLLGRGVYQPLLKILIVEGPRQKPNHGCMIMLCPSERASERYIESD